MRIRNSSAPETKNFGVLLPVLGLLGVLIIGTLAPRETRANSGNSFLETIGISIAVGTVLGASTLPFYDQPGKHVMNLAYGASAGAVAGVGLGIYGWIAGSDNEYEYSRLDNRDDLLAQTQPVLTQFSSQKLLSSRKAGAGQSARRLASLARAQLSQPALIWMPVVSLNW